MTLRYGLIGSGMMGHEHIRNVALTDGAEIVAVSDPDTAMRQSAKELAGESVQAFDTVSDLLSADICDAFIIAAPNDTHHQILLDILDANKPILCEKPLCTTIEHCREVLAKAEGKAPVWVAMEYRYMPPLQRFIRMVHEGVAGDPIMLSIREHRFPFLPKVGDWNRFSQRTGGTLVEKCCHFWDLMRLILQSDPVRVYASAAMDVNHLEERYEGRQPDIIDNAFVIVNFANGARAMLDLCMFAEASYWQEVLSATGAKARIDACIPAYEKFWQPGEERHAKVVVSDRETCKVTDEEIPVDPDILAAGSHHGSTFYQHRKFAEMVRNGGTRPEVSLEDGMWAVRVGAAAEKSARTGQSVTL